MTENYISVAEAIEKYKLNVSKFNFALRKSTHNGLYKVIHRKRCRIYLREDYLERWLVDNDVVSPCEPNCSTGRPRSMKSHAEKWKPKKGNKGNW